MQLDLNLLFREPDEDENHVDPYWEDSDHEQSYSSEKQNRVTTGHGINSASGASSTATPLAGSAIRGAKPGEASDHQAAAPNEPYRVGQTAKRKRGSGRAGAPKKRRRRYRPYGPVTVRHDFDIDFMSFHAKLLGCSLTRVEPDHMFRCIISMKVHAGMMIVMVNFCRSFMCMQGVPQ